jgi:uncharacterized membrane protein (DUF485 family)
VGGNEDSAGSGRLEWIATALVAAVYLAFMLSVSLWPDWIAAPVSDNGLLSRGLLLGAAVATGTVVVAAVYTWIRNRQGDDHSGTGTATRSDMRSDIRSDTASRR